MMDLIQNLKSQKVVKKTIGLLMALALLSSCLHNYNESTQDTFTVDFAEDRATFLNADSVYVIATDSSFRFFEILYGDKVVDEKELSRLALPKLIQRPYIVEVYVFSDQQLDYGRQIFLYENELTRTILYSSLQSKFPPSFLEGILPSGIYP